MGTTLDNFHPGFVYGIQQALAACPGASIGSGYRTIDEQRALLYKRDQGILVADPGTSRHEGNKGGAVDVSGDLDCFAAAAARYGIVNTEVPGEPWHFQLSAEALQQIEDGTYQWGEEEDAAEEEQPDSLAAIRDMIFGGGANPDIPERVAAGLGEKEQAAAEVEEGEEEFVPQASAGYDAAGGGAMSAVDVAKVYAQAGFTGDALVTMVAISRGESGWNPAAHGDTTITTGTWGPSIGLSQIRSLNEQNGTGGWRDASRLQDPLFNARAAYAISNGGTNFGPWTVYSKGIYTQFVEEAKAAVAALGSAGLGGSGPPAASVDDDPEKLIPDDLGLQDPASLANEIAEMVLKAKGDPGDIVGRIGEVEEEEPDDEVLGEKPLEVTV